VSRRIAVTFDYRCPFARNAHEAVIAAVREGVDIDYKFQAFSLDQVHVEEGTPPVWERPEGERGGGVRALEWGITIRDHFPNQFLDAHGAFFAARHDKGLKLADEDVLRDVAIAAGVDPEAVAAEIATGEPLKILAKEHTEAVERWNVFGVPTFCENEDAVFIRFMDRGRTDDLARAVELLDWTRFNEFKRTRVPR
jgi:predicted DsbA family dithiol-disulfide isomerase